MARGSLWQLREPAILRATAAVDRLDWRRDSARGQSRMPRFDRQTLMEKFQDMKRRRVPIVGGGAGTGLSAKCEEEGGIDLIVIYNSGRYRMAGRGSLSGILAYGNANDIVMEMAREVLPVTKRTPVLAGSTAPIPSASLTSSLMT